MIPCFLSQSFHPQSLRRVLGLAGLALLTLPILGCPAAPGDTPAGASATAGSDGASQVELPYVMLHLHEHTDKLGWSVAAQNQGLSRYYLRRIDADIAEIQRIGTWQGKPVHSLAPTMLRGAVDRVKEHVEANDWPAATESYGALTIACTQCHAVTGEPQLVILPVSGTPPAGQRFGG